MSVAVAAVTVSAGASLYSTYENGKAADKAAKNQEKAIDAQNRIAQQQLDMAKEDRQYYMDTYRPMEEEIVANAGLTSAEQQEMVANAGLTVSNSMDAAAAQRDRNLQRMGVNPNSGAYAASTRKNAIAKAVAKANAQNNARTQAKEIDYNQRVAAVGLGKGLTGSAAGLMSSAASAYGNNAQLYGQQMNTYGQAASNSMNMGMQMLGSAMGAYGENGFNSQQFGNNMIGNYGAN